VQVNTFKAQSISQFEDGWLRYRKKDNRYTHHQVDFLLGVALSDIQLHKATKLKVLTIDPQVNVKNYDFRVHVECYSYIKQLIRSKCVKGIVGTYPLDY